MPTAVNEIQQALGDSAADFQTVWESSAGGVTYLKGPSSTSSVDCLAVVHLLILMGKDFSYRPPEIAGTFLGHLGSANPTTKEGSKAS